MTPISVFDLPPTPWKNGGGTTREIAQSPGPKGFSWRLSVADVDSEGPFSRFSGLSRILTVIEGDGFELYGPDGRYDLRRLVPFRFSGDADVSSRLGTGPIRDFNVIYDHDLIDADVEVLVGPVRRELSINATEVLAIFCVEGRFAVDGRQFGRGWFQQFTDANRALELFEESACLKIMLAPKSRV